MTDIPQNGKVALVTGASRGIGAAVARLLASRGMAVAVNYLSSGDEANAVVASIEAAGGRALAVQGDVRDESAVLGMVEQIRAGLGEVEVMVHNALIPYAIKSFDEISWDELGGKNADGRHDPAIANRALAAVAGELGVPAVPDASDIYRTQPADE